MPVPRALFDSLIDYAGLFPPASLPMRTAVENFTRYRASPESWMLARFVVPVSRLDEFEICAPRHGWKLTALIGDDLEHELARIAEFNRGVNQIDAIEMKAADVRQVERAAALVPEGVTSYFEIAGPMLLDAIRAAGPKARAKIRTGGVTPDAFPAAACIARFLEACAEAGVAFKATAGLHHPLRCERPLTYSADGPTGWMYGFLNVFIAATLACRGVRGDELERVLMTRSLADLPKVAAGEAAQARHNFAISFGSCSFDEPVAGLKALSLL